MGGAPEEFVGMNERNSRTAAMQEASSAHSMSALPFRICTSEPPSSWVVSVSPIAALTSWRPAMPSEEVPLTIGTKSENEVNSAEPANAGPITAPTCGAHPETQRLAPEGAAVAAEGVGTGVDLVDAVPAAVDQHHQRDPPLQREVDHADDLAACRCRRGCRRGP